MTTTRTSAPSGDRNIKLPKPPQVPLPKDPPPVVPPLEQKEYGFPPPPIIRRPKPKGR